MSRFASALLLVALLVLLWYARTTVLLLFTAVLLAIMLDAGCSSIQRRIRLPRILALFVLIVVIGSIIGLVLWLRGGAIVEQITDLRTALPLAVDRVTTEFAQTSWGRWLGANAPSTQGVPMALSLIAQRLGGLISGTLSAVLGVAFVIFVAVCLAIEPSLYYNGTIRLFSPERRTRIRTVLLEIGEMLRWWLIARLISMIVLAILVTVGLSVLRIPLAGALGIIAGLLAFIPNIGAIVAALPALVFAFAIAPERALAVLVMYWVCHFLDDFFIVPTVERKVVQLPPALTITAQVLLSSPGGVLGIMLAAPLTACAIILARRFWVDDVLERRSAA